MRGVVNPPDGKNYPAHKCEWGYRNPRNHLSRLALARMIQAMLDRGDQKIICPGCEREIYLSLKIESHNKSVKRTDKRVGRARKFVDTWAESGE